MSRHLVFGASGYIGGHLVPFLHGEGCEIRATARNIEVLESREWTGVELAEADALRPD
ncbi:MAG: NmrA family NAD(P)-binding protein, partial [Gammaproteobacteria bacterium]|nr:NmrA family NAD(P)-binding protein [Gammaproteobacteria bacterium]